MSKKCYAKSLGNCSNRISKEHYISKSVLELIDNLTIKGAGWLDGQDEIKLAPSAITSKVLCEYHNSELSHLGMYSVGSGQIF